MYGCKSGFRSFEQILFSNFRQHFTKSYQVNPRCWSMVSAAGAELSCQELYLIQVIRISENTAEYSSISLMWRTGLQMHFDSFLTYKVSYCFDYRTGIAICHKLCGMTKLLLASCFPTYNVYYSQNNTNVGQILSSWDCLPCDGFLILTLQFHFHVPPLGREGHDIILYTA